MMTRICWSGYSTKDKKIDGGFVLEKEIIIDNDVISRIRSGEYNTVLFPCDVDFQSPKLMPKKFKASFKNLIKSHAERTRGFGEFSYCDYVFNKNPVRIINLYSYHKESKNVAPSYFLLKRAFDEAHKRNVLCNCSPNNPNSRICYIITENESPKLLEKIFAGFDVEYLIDSKLKSFHDFKERKLKFVKNIGREEFDKISEKLNIEKDQVRNWILESNEEEFEMILSEESNV